MPIEAANELETRPPESAGIGRRRFWALLLGLATAIGLLQFTYFYLADLTEGVRGPWLDPFLSEMSAAYGVALLFPAVLRLTRRFPFRAGGYARAAAVHGVGLILFSAVHTSWMWGSRTLLWPTAGLGRYDYGIMPIRYFMEFPSQAITYAVIVALITLYDRNQEARERALRISHLEAQLAVARFHNLQAQVRPHFLFNALNTVSSVMYEDLSRADRVITALADLLRRTLHDSERVFISLREELDLLERYLEIMRARYGPRLQAAIHAPAGLSDVAVPSLLLQPLVENAVKHGDPGEGRPMRIRVEVSRTDGSAGEIVFVVEDNGPGPIGDVPDLVRRGVGLSNTAERLKTLYGPAHDFQLIRGEEGGLRLEIRIPERPVPAGPAALEPER